jgi:hypothetical protein
MVSEVRFYPTGYVGTEQAAVLLARLLQPANWKPETFIPGEQQLWEELGRSLNATFIENPLVELREAAKKANIDFSPMRTRWADFDCAMQELQKSLFAGAIKAECCDADGKQLVISKEFWGGDHSVDSLLNGLLQTTYPRVVILIEVGAVQSLATSIAAPASSQKSDGRDAFISDAPARKRGRPKEHYWPAVQRKVFELMDYHQDFDASDAEWQTQAHLVRAIKKYIEEKFDAYPAKSTIEANISPMVAEWRRSKKR